MSAVLVHAETMNAPPQDVHTPQPPSAAVASALNLPAAQTTHVPSSHVFVSVVESGAGQLHPER